MCARHRRLPRARDSCVGRGPTAGRRRVRGRRGDAVSRLPPGEGPPPGSLHATPAVERLVQRALDTENQPAVYRSATDLLENLLRGVRGRISLWSSPIRGGGDQGGRGCRTPTRTSMRPPRDLLASLGVQAGRRAGHADSDPSIDHARGGPSRFTIPRPAAATGSDALLADFSTTGREHTRGRRSPVLARYPISEGDRAQSAESPRRSCRSGRGVPSLD